MASRLAARIATRAGMAALALCTAPVLAQDDAGRFRSPAFFSLLEFTPYAEAIASCDEERFLEAKQRLLAAFERQVAANPGNAQLQQDLLLLQVELLPDPCPPERVDLSTVSSWLPIRDIRYRGSYDRSVRAPNVVDLFASASVIDIGRTGIGVTRDGPVGDAPDRDAGLTDGTIRLIGGGGALHLGKFSFFAQYQGGDGATRFDLPPIAGGFNGAVFGGPSPADSTGIGAAAAGLAGTTRTKVSRFKIGADYELLGPTPRSRVFFAVDYFRDAIDHSTSLTGTVVFPTTTITFEQDRAQSITDAMFAAGFGAETLIPLTPPDAGAGLSLRMTGTGQAYILDTTFLSSERNRSNFGPASDRDFTLVFEDDDQTLGFHARGQLNLEYMMSPDFLLFMGAAAEWFSDGGAVVNPSSGTAVQGGATTGFQHVGRWSYGGVLGARFRF